MKVSLSGLITDARGILGNAIASKNKHGNYIKSYAVPAVSYAAQNQAVRTYYSRVIAAWKALSQSSKADWALKAATYTFVNNLGNSYHPSGFQLFIFCNMNLFGSSHAIITTATNYVSTPVPEPSLDNPVISTNHFVLEGLNSFPSGYYLKMYTSEVVNQGLALAKLPTKLFAVYTNSIGSNYNMWTDWVKVLSSVPTANSIIQVEYQFVVAATGQASSYGAESDTIST